MGLTYFRKTLKQKHLLLVVLVCLLLFAPSITNFFFSDDWFHLKISEIHRADEFINFFSFLRTAQFAGFYRPLSTQVFFFIFQSLFGLNPIPYHLFVGAVFVMLLWLLYKVAQEIFGSKKVALTAVFIYGVSATNFTRLYFLSAFQEVLMTVLLLGSVLAYLRSYEKVNSFRNYVVAGFLFILALASKETAVVLPGVLFLIGWWKGRLDLKRLWPLVLIALVYGYFRFRWLGGVSGESYIWDFSLKKAGNSLMWYGFWSLGLPEFLVDYVGSGLRVLPRFFGDFSSLAWPILVLGLSVIISSMSLAIRRGGSFWRTVVLGSGIFVGSLLPVIFLPWHKFTLELGLPMVGVAIILGSLLKKRSLVGYVFILVYVLTNVSTNVLYLSHHYSVNRANLSYKVYQYFVENYRTAPKNSYFEFVNDTSDFGPQWGSSKQIAQATSDSNMFKVLYNNPSYKVYFEDYFGDRPRNETKIGVSTKMFTK